MAAAQARRYLSDHSRGAGETGGRLAGRAGPGAPGAPEAADLDYHDQPL